MTGKKTLLAACKLLAVSYGTVAAAEEDLDVITLRLAAIANDVALDVLGDGYEADELCGAIHWLAGGSRAGEARQRLAQFPASLRTLLEIVCRGGPVDDEAGVFLRSVLVSVQAVVHALDAQATLHIDERGRREEDASKHEASIPQCVAGARSFEEPGPADQEASGATQDNVVPSHWERSREYEDEWVDKSLLEQARGLRKHGEVGYPHFVVDRSCSPPTIQCVLRWGNADTAATVRSAMLESAAAAFEDAMRVAAMCPDEPPQRWGAMLIEELGVSKAPNRIEFKNVVPCGIPRYTCTAYWESPKSERRSSTTRATMMEAFKEVVTLARTRVVEPAAVKPRKGIAQKLVECGLEKASVEYKADGERFKAKLSWLEMDGSRLSVTSGAQANKELAADEAIRLGLDLSENADLNWAMAVRRELAGRELGDLLVAFERPTEDSNRLQCRLVWGFGVRRVFYGPPKDTRRNAVLAAVEAMKGGKEPADSVSRVVASEFSSNHDRLRAIGQLLAQRRDGWISERATLLALQDRSQEQDARLRDLSSLVALCDPVRRQEVNPTVAAKLVGMVMAEAERAQEGRTSVMSALEQIRYLEAMCEVAPTAGAVLQRSEAFMGACAAFCKSASKVEDDLVALRVVRRNDGSKLTLTERGAKAMRRLGAGGSGYSGSNLEKT